jgi:hypothetical protein
MIFRHPREPGSPEREPYPRGEKFPRRVGGAGVHPPPRGVAGGAFPPP